MSLRSIKRGNFSSLKMSKNYYFHHKSNWINFIYLFFGHTMLLQNLSYLTKIKPGPSAVSTKSPNHLTTREFPRLILSKKKKKKRRLNYWVTSQYCPDFKITKVWGIHVNPWLIHVDVWQKPLQYCKVISLQLIKINEKNNNNKLHHIKRKKKKKEDWPQLTTARESPHRIPSQQRIK